MIVRTLRISSQQIYNDALPTTTYNLFKNRMPTMLLSIDPDSWLLLKSLIHQIQHIEQIVSLSNVDWLVRICVGIQYSDVL
jgi:hypothetical protein